MDLVRLGRRGLTFGNGSSVSVSGATNSKICIYGIKTDDWSYVWGSTFSPRCFSTGNCLGERNPLHQSLHKLLHEQEKLQHKVQEEPTNSGFKGTIVAGLNSTKNTAKDPWASNGPTVSKRVPRTMPTN